MPLPESSSLDSQFTVRPHFSQLDGLRGVAILMVFVFHAFKANLLWMGVDLFFVLSGFLITGILLKDKGKSARDYFGAFYVRRAKRILPAYVVILILSALIFGVGWLHYWYLYLGGMNVLVPMGLNHLDVHPFWSLAVEEQFYLLWPMAVFFLPRKELALLAWTLLLLAPVLRLLCAPLFASGYATYMLLPFRMDTLAAGALLAIYWPDLHRKLNSQASRRSEYRKIAGVALAVSLALALVLNSCGFLPSSGSGIGKSLLLESTLAITISLFALAMFEVGKSALNSRILVGLGRISYSFYLFHMTALYLAPKNNGIIAFFATVAYATAMWYLVEKPILQSGKREIKVEALPIEELAESKGRANLR